MLAAAADPRFAGFMRVCLATGARYLELLKVTWEGIDYSDPDKASVYIPAGPKHKGRRVPIDRPLAEMLKRMYALSPMDSGPWTFWTPKEIDTRLRSTAAAAGLRNLKPDDLSRTRVVRWIRAGMRAKAVRSLSGLSENAVRAYRARAAWLDGGKGGAA